MKIPETIFRKINFRGQKTKFLGVKKFEILSRFRTSIIYFNISSLVEDKIKRETDEINNLVVSNFAYAKLLIININNYNLNSLTIT